MHPRRQGARDGMSGRPPIVRLALRPAGSFRAQTQIVKHSAMVTRIAGMTAAANSAPVETAATEANTTAGMLGGMIGLISAELALRPTANSAG